VAWLLRTQRAASIEDAMRLVQAARPAIVLKREAFA
jgi:protein-tyrosine phosphatase